MVRILIIVPAPISGDQLALRMEQADALDLLPGTELHYRAVRASADNQVSNHDYAISEICVLEAGLSAEDDDFDAVCVDTVSDAGVDSLRSMLEIPVVGPGQAAFLTALMLGRSFSVIALWHRWKPLYVKNLTKLGLTQHCASIRSADLSPDSRNLLSGKETEVFPKLLKISEQCINEDGADVICLGSTTMHAASDYLKARLTVPVINPGPLSYKIAENLALMGLSHSKRTWPNPIVPKKEMIQAMLTAAQPLTDRHLKTTG